MRQLWWLALVFVVVLAACGTGDDDVEEEDHIVEDEVVSATTLALDEIESSSASADDEGGVVELATLLPIESGRSEGHHWIKWTLDEPIPDPADQYIKSYNLFIRSAEDDVFGVGWNLPEEGEPFGTSFCLDDKPNCNDGFVPIEWEIAPNEIKFFIQEGTFGDATGLTISATIETGATEAPEDLVTETLADGARVPLGMEERDPC